MGGARMKLVQQANGSVTVALPRELRDAVGLKPGDRVVVSVIVVSDRPDSAKRALLLDKLETGGGDNNGT